ncbi:hypothetical protein K431DRAFT_26240 [Polychaeton citri CBS 116435]|uniref:Uncharacterized protein n=1 Tax=Polychaeton citri CBS 116435 TaxID=1314669 RepID=A0A9P4PY24_9PEZI|nr:hypothetical protein K431DRAFT_26240 [Polychaeton citri CBS 116435]
MTTRNNDDNNSLPSHPIPSHPALPQIHASASETRMIRTRMNSRPLPPSRPLPVVAAAAHSFRSPLCQSPSTPSLHGAVCIHTHAHEHTHTHTHTHTYIPAYIHTYTAHSTVVAAVTPYPSHPPYSSTQSYHHLLHPPHATCQRAWHHIISCSCTSNPHSSSPPLLRLCSFSSTHGSCTAAAVTPVARTYPKPTPAPLCIAMP